MSNIESLYYDIGFLKSITWFGLFIDILEQNGNEMDLKTLMEETDRKFIPKIA